MATTTKKSTKVQAPIDRHETFVSLQKSFAESEQAAQEKLRILGNLQTADNEIEKLVQLRGELPAEVAAFKDELDAKNAKLSHLKELVSTYTDTVEACRKEIVEIDTETAKYRSQLENISNSREYDSLNKELENQDLLRQIAEKKINAAEVSIEEKNADIAKLQDSIAICEQDLAARQSELDVIVESTAKQEAELQAKRDECAAKLDERTMSAYDRIRASVHNHLAVVPIFNGDSCGGCFNSITPQRLVDVRSGKKLVICEHCGRIIINTEL